MSKLMIIAGETSGDLHGGQLVKELKALDPGLEIFGIGGDRMQAGGMELLYHVREFSFMGIAEVLGHLPFIRSVMKKMEGELYARKPDAVALIDYPGFNLQFAEKAKKARVPVIYFISPQVWAWGRGRVRNIRKFVDKMLCILPFEEEFYRGRRVNARYVGNPLRDAVKTGQSREQFHQKNGLNLQHHLVGLLPGSRKQEIELILPVMLQTSQMLKEKDPGLQFALGLAHDVDRERIESLINAASLEVTLIKGSAYDLMAYSRLLLVASGTATLEAGISGTPMIIIYKTSPLTYFIGRRLIKVPYIGLVNLVAGKKVIPEFLQHEARPGAIYLMAQVLLAEGRPRQAVMAELANIPQILGAPGAAKRAAAEIYDSLKR
ncbi:lipid-A-disaccharide synthase [candidate division TA06 bacterium]|uniref:Lipid-A-disaccharide synthase n=1 Tax=candidate division TA06 bacterium TaxID=2250710 RepID=A0A933IAF6_UNCT6|nr:lipid-A-disaccharide synthase [candidate division TA06 bacterium]